MNRTIGLITTNYLTAGYAELTERRPAACLPFGGRYRLMDFALSNMVNSRIDNVGVITPYYYRSLLDHMGAGKAWGLDRKAGGLFFLPGSVVGFKDADSRFLLRDIVRNSNYLRQGDGDYVLCSDCSFIYNMDYRPMITRHELSGGPLTLLYSRRDPGERRRGWYLTLGEDGSVKELRYGESGENLLLNCFIIDRSFFCHFMEDFRAVSYRDLFELLSENLSHIRTGSFCFEGYVGFADGLGDYMASSRDLLVPEIRRELFAGERIVYTKIHDEPPAMFSAGSRVKNSIISAGSVIEGTVENSILFREVHVARGAVVRNCVIMERGEISPGAELAWLVCDKNVKIGEGVTLAGTAEHPCILPKGKVI